MASLVQKITDKKLSRRAFLKASAAATASLTLAGCGNALAPADTKVDTAAGGQGKWIAADCWHNCGGRCVNKVLVVDGVVVRQKTDDNHPDSPDYPQQRACPRGWSQRHQVFGADRIKYPMKRKHWEPGGGDKSLRGRDEWVRISWEEALDLVAAEIKRVYTEYGPESVLCNNAHGTIENVLRLMGGHAVIWDTTSWGSFTFNVHNIGIPTVGLSNIGFVCCQSINDRIDLRTSETIVMYGMNPAWAAAGNKMYDIMQAKKAGAKFIFVGPEYNFSAAAVDAKWIRVRPGTDTAFLLAVVYTMLKEDDPELNPIIDWDFLDKYVLGFDSEHMPEDATSNENLTDYVLGKYDNTPKTPEWASEICGTPVEDIVYFAREIRKDIKVALLYSYAPARCNGSENFPQLITAVGAMGGHFGKSGHCCGLSYHTFSFNGGPPLTKVGATGLPAIKNPINVPLNGPNAWRYILEGKYNHTGNGNYGVGQYEPGETRNVDIRLIYYEGAANLQTAMNVMGGIEAHRKVDFVVTNAHFLTTQAKYSDIVLPSTTRWERIGDVERHINREIILICNQVTEPLYEAKDDAWLASELAKRLGLDPKEIFPIDGKQVFFNKVAGSTVVLEDGKTVSPLVTITQEDIDEWGVEGTPQQGVIGLKEFQERGIYQVKRYPGDNYGYIAYEDFVKDPENNPLPSKSGKFEIYCQWKGDTLNSLKYSDTVYKPYPTYIRPFEGYEDTFADWDNKVKGDYPYQVFNPHYLRRAHTALDNVPQLREAFTNPAFINAQDAREKGVKDGDTILIYSRHGKILRQACVTETLMPGCISLPHGTWVDLDEETGIDHSGSDNVLLGPVSQGMGLSGYNTCNVNFEKYTGAPLIPDDQKPLRIVDV